LIWILHHDPRARQALFRLCREHAEDVLFGSPSESQFTLGTAEEPDLVILGVASPFASELALAQSAGERFPFARWLIFAAPNELEQVRQLFDTLPAAFETWPPEPGRLARHLHAVSHLAARTPLSSRLRWAQLEARFERWFGGLALPQYPLTLDPRWWSVPVLISGEVGTGRSLMARAVAELSPNAPASKLLHISGADSNSQALEQRIQAALDAPPHRITLWLDRVDEFDPAMQRRFAHWIEMGPPGTSPSRVRWIATCHSAPLLPPAPLPDELFSRLAGIQLRLPALRELPKHARRFAEATVQAFSRAHDQRDRRLSEASLRWIEADSWPGNLRELESLLLRNLLLSENEVIELRELTSLQEPRHEDVSSHSAKEEREAPPPHLAPSAYLPGPSLQRLFGALIHEIGNPLVTLQTFIDLLPNRFQDPEFRNQFVELVPPDARRIARVVDQLRQFAAFSAPRIETVDIGALLEELLEEMREAIHARHLSVLREFDSESALCLGDRTQLIFAFGSILRTIIAILPPREHLDLLVHSDPPGSSSRMVHFAVRFRDREGREKSATGDVLSITNNTLALFVAEAIAKAQGGSFDRHREDDEALLEICLPAALP